eukprot:403363367
MSSHQLQDGDQVIAGQNDNDASVPVILDTKAQNIQDSNSGVDIVQTPPPAEKNQQDDSFKRQDSSQKEPRSYSTHQTINFSGDQSTTSSQGVKGYNNGGRTNLSSTMHMRANSTNSSFLLQSKLNPFAQSTLSNTQHITNMINAKQDKLTKHQQMIQLEARIRKLKTEEHKAHRKIEEARRQEEFISNMKMSKAQRNIQKEEYLKQLKIEEEVMRNKINEQRFNQKSMINRNFNSVVHSNKQQGFEIKEQKKRIRDMIDQNKLSHQQEKEQAFASHKSSLNNSIIFRKTVMEGFCSQNKQNYESKISQQQREAEELQKKMMELEKHEQLMIQKLQHTYKRQQSQLTKLDQVKKIQIPKASLRFDNYYYVDIKQAQEDANQKAADYIQSFDLDQDGFITYTELINSEFFTSRQDAQQYAQTFFLECGHEKDHLESAKISKDQLQKCIISIISQDQKAQDQLKVSQQKPRASANQLQTLSTPVQE